MAVYYEVSEEHRQLSEGENLSFWRLSLCAHAWLWKMWSGDGSQGWISSNTICPHQLWFSGQQYMVLLAHSVWKNTSLVNRPIGRIGMGLKHCLSLCRVSNSWKYMEGSGNWANAYSHTSAMAMLQHAYGVGNDGKEWCYPLILSGDA